jgi:hypothetical protein
MPDRIVELAGQLLRSPVRVFVAPPVTTVVLVFTRTKHRADQVARYVI